jgi:hypothetical protein
LAFSIFVPVMTRGQRFTFLGIAVVIAAVALILLAGGEDETGKRANSTPTPTPTPTATAAEGEETPTPTPTPTPKPPPLLQAGKVRKLTFDEGDTVRFRVRSDTEDEIHIHGYDITKEVEPDKTAMVSFKASITGIFEIEFHGSGTQIAELRVEP